MALHGGEAPVSSFLLRHQALSQEFSFEEEWEI